MVEGFNGHCWLVFTQARGGYRDAVLNRDARPLAGSRGRGSTRWLWAGPQTVRVRSIAASLCFAAAGPGGGSSAEFRDSIGEHLLAALEEARLCSNDPVCAEHDASDEHDPMHLLGAACHGCLLIAETSCEQPNDWLDRAFVVPTIAVLDAAFFP
jgi:hypothetical protein